MIVIMHAKISYFVVHIICKAIPDKATGCRLTWKGQ